MTSGGDRRQRDRAWLALLVALLIALRASLALGLCDVFFYGEELEKGALAKALIDGVDVDWHRLNYHYFEGASMTKAHLTAGVFLLVGQNLLAHKLVAIAWACLILVAGHRLLLDWFGRAAARTFGLLFALAPPAWQQLGLLNIGHHFENLLFVFLVLLFTLRLLLDEQPGRGSLIGLGLSAGFALYFSFSNAVLVPACLGALLLFRRRVLFAPRGAWLALALAIGAAPLLWMLSRVGTGLLDVHGVELASGSAWKQQGGKASRLLTAAFAGRGWPTELALGVTLVLPVFGAAWLLGDAGRRSSRAARAFALVAALGLLLFGVFLASPFTAGRIPHYFGLARLSTYWGLGLVLTSATLGLFWTSGRAALRLAAGLATAALLLAGTVGLRDALAKGRPGSHGSRWETLTRTKGYDYEGYFSKLRAHLEGSVEERIAPLLGYDEPAAGLLRIAIAETFLIDRRAELDEVLAPCRAIDAEHWEDYARGLGPWLMARAGGGYLRAVEDLRAHDVRGETGEPVRSLLWYALGGNRVSRLATPAVLEKELELARRPGEAGPDPALLRGMGRRLYHCFPLDRPAALAFLERLSDWRLGAQSGAMRAGYEEELRANTLPAR